MQFFSVLEKNAAATDPLPIRYRDDFFQNLLPPPRRSRHGSGGGSGSATIDISDSCHFRNQYHSMKIDMFYLNI
jgi:hypothetical protein